MTGEGPNYFKGPHAVLYTQEHLDEWATRVMRLVVTADSPSNGEAA